MSIDRVVSQGIGDRVASLVGGPTGRRMAQWNGLVPLIGSYAEGYKDLDDRQLRLAVGDLLRRRNITDTRKVT